MGLSLLTNIASLQAQNNVDHTQGLVSASVQRLSSGLRINQASDDAAGLAISSKLSAEIRGLAQAQRNGNDAVSMVQTAEGALGQINDLLTRMRELAVESANGGTLSNSDRTAVNTEYTALDSEITRIVNVTTYNGQLLIDGSLSAGVSFQVGAFNTANDRIAIAITASDATTLGVNTTAVDTAANAQSALNALDAAIETVANNRANIGANQNRVQSAINNLETEQTNLVAANSRILDVDVAQESSNLARTQILLQAGVSVLAQANQIPSSALQLLRG